ncbi:MAG: NUDIX hydrolase [Clostridiales bacterium]|jgi:ADP-ribose pyrophosphatase|nr:NUDIX hydrolase [Clostridiales bacterium]
MKPYTTINSKEIFKGRAVHLVVDEITLPNGQTTFRETVHNHDAAAILPIDSEGDVILVRQYRHSVGRAVLEIPAGILDENEEPEICAARELEEEIGYKAGSLTKICAWQGSIGICSGKTYLFLAKNLIEGIQATDYDEFISVERYSLEECEKMVLSGEIVDGKTILAIFAYKAMGGNYANI